MASRAADVYETPLFRFTVDMFSSVSEETLLHVIHNEGRKGPLDAPEACKPAACMCLTALVI